MTNNQAHEQTAMTEAELTLSEAAEACGVSRSTMRRARESGRLPRAHQRRGDGGWLVPVTDLLRAGFTLTTPNEYGEAALEQSGMSGAEQTVSTPVDELITLRTRLAALEAESAGLKELVRSKDQTIAALETRSAVDLRESAGAEVDVREIPAQPVPARPVPARRWWKRST